jgi:hypothetical protein
MLISSVTAPLYNTTNMTNADNILDQAVALNVHVNYFIGLGIIISVFTITFVIISGNYDAIAGLGSASFISLISATMLLPLNLIHFNIWSKVAIINGVSIAIALLVKRN